LSLTVAFCASARRGAARTVRRAKNFILNERLERQLMTVRM
jgi:hypothetical protein